MRPYICFYRDRKIVVHAESSYKAQLEAAKQFKVKASNKITVMLADVIHSTCELP